MSAVYLSALQVSQMTPEEIRKALALASFATPAAHSCASQNHAEPVTLVDSGSTVSIRTPIR